MKVTIHQTHQNIADFNAIKNYLFSLKNDSGLHLFPEMFLCGYPLQDLIFQKPFVSAYEKFLLEIKEWSQSLPSDVSFLVGGIEYISSGEKQGVFNCIYLIEKEVGLKSVYRKKLLPNYDIFDEKKYFTSGDQLPLEPIITVQEHKLALMVCEDMWPEAGHSNDPYIEITNHTDFHSISAVINLSASPFHYKKNEMRIERAFEIQSHSEVPFFYVNKVGGEDEILFDGGSFILDHNEVFSQGAFFNPCTLNFSLKKNTSKKENIYKNSKNLTLDRIFEATINLETSPPTLEKLQNTSCERILQSLCFGLREYLKKSGMKSVLVALSGGIDSSLALAIAHLAFKNEVPIEAIYMPSQYSASMSRELSEKLCKNLDVPLIQFPIKFLHSALRRSFEENFQSPLEGVSDENIQSRIRGLLLYGRSNLNHSMVINTSNKSEIAVGYSTLYGDSVGAISVLGDLYKTEVYELSRYINKKYNSLIPEGIITRPPSAELRENQQDSESLPPYEILDCILEGILSYHFDKNDFLNQGFNEKEINLALNLYKKTEYKRYQFCPILKVKPKSFGFGYRIPICKDSTFYESTI